MTEQPGRITAPLLDVLATFIAAGGDELHGWAIIKTSKRGGPTVYKILERLTSMGWITARWEDLPAEPDPSAPIKPRRRYYRLTGEGATRAQALLAERRPATSQALRPALGGGLL
ncbi:PadR family transcriptional regulator [Actinoplanes sp. NPDC049599]|uniref:PadR family transcriptional regulator n=1 Tax=Actinoplanes sp. NPDC049599 TaxID=3363903 RepID=UPI0037A9BDB0